MNTWLALVLGLPTANATERMRAWRALKATGAAVLRDGVYLLPHTDACHAALRAVERDILAINGMAVLLPVVDPNGARFAELFDRADDYTRLGTEIDECRLQLDAQNALATTRQVRKLRKAYARLAGIDYFPGQPKQQIDEALKSLEVAVSQALSADEPGSRDVSIVPLNTGQYQGRTWATRRRPWVDRLASAWLIQRFIDANARFVWLEHPSDCPTDALGFDFDEASFSHVGHRVTFETLKDSFDLQVPGLSRLASLVHYLDVGGIQPVEAAGVERVLAGLRETIADDDQLLNAAGAIFDGLLAGFAREDATYE